MQTTYAHKPLISRKLEKVTRRFKNRRDIHFSLTRPIISLTFDDFPVSAITHGAKPMHDYGWTGTFYVSAGLEGVTNHHGLQFDRGDLIWLESKGHEIAGHTYNHVDCTALSVSSLDRQFSKNKEALRDMGVRGSIDGFAFPFGEANAQLKSQLGERFDAVRGIKDGVHYSRADLNELKACGLYSSTVERICKRITSLAQKPGWLILFTHDICENPSEWGLTPTEFTRVLRLIDDSGAQVLPVRDAIQQLRGGRYHG